MNYRMNLRHSTLLAGPLGFALFALMRMTDHLAAHPRLSRSYGRGSLRLRTQLPSQFPTQFRTAVIGARHRVSACTQTYGSGR